MQLKAIMRNLSKEKKVSAQLLLQNYMLERLLERVSQSEYSSNFIIKGGFLIAAMVGERYLKNGHKSYERPPKINAHMILDSAHKDPNIHIKFLLIFKKLH